MPCHSRVGSWVICAALGMSLVGCTVPVVSGVPDTSSEPEESDTSVSVVSGDPVTCETEPVHGFDRFTRADEARGFTEPIDDLRVVIDNEDARSGAGLAAGDLDGDGDVDLAAGRFIKTPLVYLNDGTGHFTPDSEMLGAVRGTFSDAAYGSTLAFAYGVIDIDGDGLPEVLSAGFGYIAAYPNLGDGRFGDPVLLHNDEGPNVGMYFNFAVGDMDGDTDLDIALISDVAVDTDCDDTPAACEFVEWPDYLLENQGGLSFSGQSIYSAPDGSHSLVALFTDRDNDDDMDLFVPKDYHGQNAFWRNDGGGTWVDDDVEIGADYTWAAMGLDSVDLNGDGFLDYCLTDTGPMRCLLSMDGATYVEGAAALGLVPDGEQDTVGWSVIFNDLDNDGNHDAAYVSGPMGQQEHVLIEDVPDLMWSGNADGTFTDVSNVAGFNDINDNYGMVQADFDGDGFLELVVSGATQPLQYYDNACNDNHWIGLRFVGPGDNTEGWGAKITVEAGDRTWMRELVPMGGPAHSPPRAHFGLGDRDTVDRVTVTWPGGASATAVNLPTRREHTLTAQ